MQTGSVSEIIGQTPLIRLNSLSERTGCQILAKAEFANPGGSVKDRTALGIILDAEKQGLLKSGDTLVEGTAGNTGIGLAVIAAQRNYKCLIVMPDNQAQEKYDTLRALGVELVLVKPVPFANPAHFYHTAKRLATEQSHAYWANQFENTANYRIHEQTTGPEIWAQTNGKIDAFVAASGTGGTIAGVSRFLKSKRTDIKIILADPMGSGLHSYIQTQQLASTGSSITEGIGIMRLTANFKEAQIDESLQITDQDMISTLYHLAQHDGLLVGTSAALNVFASYQFALKHQGSGKTIVTILCDSASRYQSKVFNPQFLNEKNLKPVPLF